MYIKLKRKKIPTFANNTSRKSLAAAVNIVYTVIGKYEIVEAFFLLIAALKYAHEDRGDGLREQVS